MRELLQGNYQTILQVVFYPSSFHFRSGLALKNFIDTGAGVVDFDYRGNVGVVLFNHGEDDFSVSRGDRIAQLILERISMAQIEETEELPSTERGAGGFGSTGVSNQEDGDTIFKRFKAGT
jgi:deoxyuridine 5'-triphosphate nucleotidohydrolase